MRLLLMLLLMALALQGVELAPERTYTGPEKLSVSGLRDDGSDRLIGVELRDKAHLFDGHRSFELANHQCQ